MVVRTEMSGMITSQIQRSLLERRGPGERQNEGEFHDADSVARPRSRGCGFF
jgi:hypothetical protein